MGFNWDLTVNESIVTIIMNDKKLMDRAADNIRILAASMVEKAKSGHPGGAMDWRLLW